MDTNIDTCLSLIEQKNFGATVENIPSRYLHNLHDCQRYSLAAFFGYTNFEYCQAPKQKIDYFLIAIARNHINLAKYLIEENNWDFENVKDEIGNLCYHYAAMYNRKKALDILINLSSKNKKKINSLNNYHENLLMVAIEKKEMEMVKYLLTLNPNLKQKSNTNKDFISYAIKTKDPNIYDFFIKNSKYKKYIRNEHLIDAISNENLELAIYLENKFKLSVNHCNALGETPFMIGAKLGNMEIIQYYKEKTENLFKKNNNNDDALFLSIASKNIDITKYFINNLSWNIKNNLGFNGRNIVLEAIFNRNTDVVEYLFSNECPNRFETDDEFIDEDGNNSFLVACQTGSWETVEWVLDNINIDDDLTNCVNNDGDNGLHLAVKYYYNFNLEETDTTLLDNLFDLDLDPEEIDSEGNTVFLNCENRYVLNYLENDRDVNVLAKNHNHDNLLIKLAKKGMGDTIIWICENMFEVNDLYDFLNKQKRNAIMEIITNCDIVTIKYILDKWVLKCPNDINRALDDSKHAMRYFIAAAQSGKKIVWQMIENILEYMMPDTLRDNQRNDCLMYAIMTKSEPIAKFELIKFLVEEYKWDLERKNTDGKTAIDIAENYPEILNYLKDVIISRDWRLRVIKIFRNFTFNHISLDEKEQCSACLSDIDNNELIISCDNNHWCHWNCIVDYATSNNKMADKCFMCRQKISEKIYLAKNLFDIPKK